MFHRNSDKKINRNQKLYMYIYTYAYIQTDTYLYFFTFYKRINNLYQNRFKIVEFLYLTENMTFAKTSISNACLFMLSRPPTYI